jgi:sugar phosphate isomerase/epimerase
MSKIFIRSFREYPNGFDALLEYTKEHRYNLEITTFILPRILDTNWQEVLKDYQRKLHEFKGAISVHGACQNLVIHSDDKKVREVAKQRIFQSLEIARELKAKYVIFHLNFNPLTRGERYKLDWIEQNASFWSEVLEKYPSTVLLENAHDFTPEMLRTMVDEVNSSHLKICLDVGHVNVWSKVSLEEWIAVLGEDIRSIHVTDNKGDLDSHLPPGKGTINWQEFSDLIAKYQIDPDIVFEVRGYGQGELEATIQSLKYFREENIYPCNTKTR